MHSVLLCSTMSRSTISYTVGRQLHCWPPVRLHPFHESTKPSTPTRPDRAQDSGHSTADTYPANRAAPRGCPMKTHALLVLVVSLHLEHVSAIPSPHPSILNFTRGGTLNCYHSSIPHIVPSNAYIPCQSLGGPVLCDALTQAS